MTGVVEQTRTPLVVTDYPTAFPNRTGIFGTGTFTWTPNKLDCRLLFSAECLSGWGAHITHKVSSVGVKHTSRFVARIRDNTDAAVAVRAFPTMAKARSGTVRAMKAIAEGRAPAVSWKTIDGLFSQVGTE